MQIRHSLNFVQQQIRGLGVQERLVKKLNGHLGLGLKVGGGVNGAEGALPNLAIQAVAIDEDAAQRA